MNVASKNHIHTQKSFKPIKVSATNCFQNFQTSQKRIQNSQQKQRFLQFTLSKFQATQKQKNMYNIENSFHDLKKQYLVEGCLLSSFLHKPLFFILRRVGCFKLSFLLLLSITIREKEKEKKKGEIKERCPHAQQ